ncbi:MAG: ABC transporter substrate binding protein [bacterium]
MSSLSTVKAIRLRHFLTSAFGLAMLFGGGCGGGNTSAPSVSGNNSAGSGAVKPADTRSQEKTVAIIRLDSVDYGNEPGLQSLQDGINQSLKTNQKYKLVEYNAGGKMENIAGQIDKAIADGSMMLVTLLDSTTMIASEKKPEIPIVFAMANNPVSLGIISDKTPRTENATGATLPHRLTLTVPIARGSLPKATKMALLFDPDNKLSTVHRDDLLKCDWAKVEPIPASYSKDQNWSSLMEDIKKKGAEAVILTNGLGNRSAGLIAAATAQKLPVFGALNKQAGEGAIFTREPRMRWTGFEVGRRVGRILSGEKAADIPIVEGDHYQTVVNTKAAKDIGVTILPAIMRDIQDVSKPGETVVGGATQNK